MEGLNKVFTSELQTYVSELKEVMFQKGYSDCQVQTYNKTWQSILSYASVQPNQEFTEGFRQQFLQDVCAEALEKRDSMYRITRAVTCFQILHNFTLSSVSIVHHQQIFRKSYMIFFRNS